MIRSIRSVGSCALSCAHLAAGMLDAWWSVSFFDLAPKWNSSFTLAFTIKKNREIGCYSWYVHCQTLAGHTNLRLSGTCVLAWCTSEKAKYWRSFLIFSPLHSIAREAGAKVWGRAGQPLDTPEALSGRHYFMVRKSQELSPTSTTLTSPKVLLVMDPKIKEVRQHKTICRKSFKRLSKIGMYSHYNSSAYYSSTVLLLFSVLPVELSTSCSC